MSDEEKVVSWFEENYKSLIFGVVIGLTLLFGYKSYLSSQNSAQLELSRPVSYTHLTLPTISCV